MAPIASPWQSPALRENELDLTVQENTLIVTGAAQPDAEGEERVFLHRGIAKRAFERRFQLADTIKVTGASYANGLLNIELVREIPEHKKPRKVAIGTSSRSHGPQGDQARRRITAGEPQCRPPGPRLRRSFSCGTIGNADSSSPAPASPGASSTARV